MLKEKEYVTKVPDFQTLPSAERDKAIDQAVKFYHEIVAEVIEQLNNSNLSNEGKVYAIYLLGQLRATAAVTILIENINLKASNVDRKSGIGRWGMYPAQEALSKIGNPAVNMIIDLLPGEKEELRRKLMCFVLVEVEGADTAKYILRQAVAAESDPNRQVNLQDALINGSDNIIEN